MRPYLWVFIFNICLFVYFSPQIVCTMLRKYYKLRRYILCVHLPLALLKKIAFPMCNILFYYIGTYCVLYIVVYAVQCVRSVALRRPWHFYISYRTSHKTRHGHNRRTTIVVVSFYCRKRLWWAIVGHKEK